jgi:hypothetical protein
MAAVACTARWARLLQHCAAEISGDIGLQRLSDKVAAEWGGVGGSEMAANALAFLIGAVVPLYAVVWLLYVR